VAIEEGVSGMRLRELLKSRRVRIGKLLTLALLFWAASPAATGRVAMAESSPPESEAPRTHAIHWFNLHMLLWNSSEAWELDPKAFGHDRDEIEETGCFRPEARFRLRLFEPFPESNCGRSGSSRNSPFSLRVRAFWTLGGARATEVDVTPDEEFADPSVPTEIPLWERNQWTAVLDFFPIPPGLVPAPR
jgi:hypothetical protein